MGLDIAIFWGLDVSILFILKGFYPFLKFNVRDLQNSILYILSIFFIQYFEYVLRLFSCLYDMCFAVIYMIYHLQ